MVLSRLDYIKDFIDYLTEEFDKEIRWILKNDGMTDKEIEESWEWRERNEYKTRSGDCWADLTSFIDSIIYEYQQNYEIKENYKIEHGIEQIVFIFDDIVYKISSSAIGVDIDNFISELSEEYQSLFSPYTFVEKYKDCYIYTQEKITIEYESDDDIGTTSCGRKPSYRGYIRSPGCRAAIVKKYGWDWLDDFCEELASSGYPLDLHSENWGYDTEGNIKIIDPIYISDC